MEIQTIDIIHKDKKVLYSRWTHMLLRCRNPNNKSYKNYGGRGITVCDEWTDFPPFFYWAINNGFSEDLTLERLDVDKGYNPDNCKWIPLKHQSSNRRNSQWVYYRGEWKTRGMWAIEFNLPSYIVRNRINLGWDLDDVFHEPIKQVTLSIKDDDDICIDGVTNPISYWLDYYNVTINAVRGRMRAWNCSIEKALTSTIDKPNTDYNVPVTYNNQVKSAYEWAEELGLSKAALKCRKYKFKEASLYDLLFNYESLKKKDREGKL